MFSMVSNAIRVQPCLNANPLQASSFKLYDQFLAKPEANISWITAISLKLYAVAQFNNGFNLVLNNYYVCK